MFLERILIHPERDYYAEFSYITSVRDFEVRIITALQDYIKNKGGIGHPPIRVREESAFTGVLQQ